MVSISFSSKGSFKNLEKFLATVSKPQSLFSQLDSVAKEGVKALEAATPTDTALAAGSWGYEVKITKTACFINYTNSDIENGFPVAVMIQLGHATGTGGYIQGRDYINPALRPVFDKIADKAWKVVTSA